MSNDIQFYKNNFADTMQQLSQIQSAMAVFTSALANSMIEAKKQSEIEYLLKCCQTIDQLCQEHEFTEIDLDNAVRPYFKQIVNWWSNNIKNHPYHNLGEKIQITKAIRHSFHFVKAVTHYEYRYYQERQYTRSGTLVDIDDRSPRSENDEIYSMERPEFKLFKSGTFERVLDRHYVRCTQCSGQGRIRCSSCSGRGQVACHRCDGRGKVKKYKDDRSYWETCDAYGCMNGKKDCSSCHGTGDNDCYRCDAVGELELVKYAIFEQPLESSTTKLNALENVLKRIPDFSNHEPNISYLNKEICHYCFDDDDDSCAVCIHHSNFSQSHISSTKNISDVTIQPLKMLHTEGLLKNTIREINEKYDTLAGQFVEACMERNDKDTRGKGSIRYTLGNRIHFGVLPYTEVQYTFEGRPYSLFIYGTSGAFIEYSSPISEYANVLRDKCRENIEQKNYDDALHYIDECVRIYPNHQTTLKLREKVVQEIKGQYQLGLPIPALIFPIFIGLCLNEIKFLNKELLPIGIAIGIGLVILFLGHLINKNLASSYLYSVKGKFKRALVGSITPWFVGIASILLFNLVIFNKVDYINQGTAHKDPYVASSSCSISDKLHCDSSECTFIENMGGKWIQAEGCYINTKDIIPYSISLNTLTHKSNALQSFNQIQGTAKEKEDQKTVSLFKSGSWTSTIERQKLYTRFGVSPNASAQSAISQAKQKNQASVQRLDQFVASVLKTKKDPIESHVQSIYTESQKSNVYFKSQLESSLQPLKTIVQKRYRKYSLENQISLDKWIFSKLDIRMLSNVSERSYNLFYKELKQKELRNYSQTINKLMQESPLKVREYICELKSNSRIQLPYKQVQTYHKRADRLISAKVQKSAQTQLKHLKQRKLNQLGLNKVDGQEITKIKPLIKLIKQRLSEYLLATNHDPKVHNFRDTQVNIDPCGQSVSLQYQTRLTNKQIKNGVQKKSIQFKFCKELDMCNSPFDPLSVNQKIFSDETEITNLLNLEKGSITFEQYASLLKYVKSIKDPALLKSKLISKIDSEITKTKRYKDISKVEQLIKDVRANLEASRIIEQQTLDAKSEDLFKHSLTLIKAQDIKKNFNPRKTLFAAHSYLCSHINALGGEAQVLATLEGKSFKGHMNQVNKVIKKATMEYGKAIQSNRSLSKRYIFEKNLYPDYKTKRAYLAAMKTGATFYPDIDINGAQVKVQLCDASVEVSYPQGPTVKFCEAAHGKLMLCTP